MSMTRDEAFAALDRGEYSLPLAVEILVQWQPDRGMTRIHGLMAWLVDRAKPIEMQAEQAKTDPIGLFVAPGVCKADIVNLLCAVIQLKNKHNRLMHACYGLEGSEVQRSARAELQRAIERVSDTAHVLLRRMNP